MRTRSEPVAKANERTLDLASPTPLERLQNASKSTGTELWIKRDDRSHPRYGGNKPRKLAAVLERAREAGADTLVTMGAVGSHHALATAVHGGALGFEVHAILAPQRWTEHAESVVRATLSHGAIVHPCPSLALLHGYGLALEATLRARGRRVLTIPVGATNVDGASGYWDAMLELRAQIEGGGLDGRWPDVIVVAHGSGGTHAGLLAAQRAHDLSTRVLGVMVSVPWAIPRLRTALLARRVLARRAPGRHGAGATIALRDVELVFDQLGEGYGAPTAAGDEATSLFALDGVALDPTYTAKAAAAALALARRGRARRVLFWHTLSSARHEPSIDARRSALSPSIERLFVRASRPAR